MTAIESRSELLTAVLHWTPEDDFYEAELELLEVTGGAQARSDSELSDAEWLREYVGAVGVESLLPDGFVRPQVASLITIHGVMVSTRYESQDGVDYDEVFQVMNIEIAQI